MRLTGVDAAEDPDLVAFCVVQHPRLVGSLTLYCGDPDVAHELAQEALARAVVHWRKVREMAAPGPWLQRVAMNLASSHFRRRSAERRALARHPRDREVDDVLHQAITMTVRSAVASLPRRQRMALVLRYYADLSVEDTALAMGCAPGTVKALTSQAVARLRTVPGLLPEGVGVDER